MMSRSKEPETGFESLEDLITEMFKMDRLCYLENIREKEFLTSLQMTRQILAQKKNLKPEQIKDEEISKSNPNINKRLKDLANLGILNDDAGIYTLSPIGSLLMDVLSGLKSDIDVIKKYKWFFDTHDYTIIPSQHLREIHKLQFAKQCADIFEYKREIERSTANVKYGMHIVTDRLHDIPSWIIEELKQGNLSLKLVYQFKKPFDINSDDEEERNLWKELKQEIFPEVKLRYLTLEDRNPIGIRIIDKKWAIFNLFERAEDKLNRPRSFCGTHEQFIAWVEDVFSSMWSESSPLDKNNVSF